MLKMAGLEAKPGRPGKVYSQSTLFRDYNKHMTTMQHMDIREFRERATGIAGEWSAVEDAVSGAYKVR